MPIPRQAADLPFIADIPHPNSRARALGPDGGGQARHIGKSVVAPIPRPVFGMRRPAVVDHHKGRIFIALAQAGGHLRILDDFLVGTDPIGVIPIVRAVNRGGGKQGLGAHGAAETLARLKGGAIRISAENNFRRQQRASAQNHALAAAANIQPQGDPRCVVLPEAQRPGLGFHAEALGKAALALLLRIRSIGNQHKPRHAPFGHDAAPFQGAPRPLPGVAVNAHGLPALFRLGEAPAQAQIAQGRIFRLDFRPENIAVQRYGKARVRPYALWREKGLPPLLGVKRRKIGKPRNHRAFFLSMRRIYHYHYKDVRGLFQCVNGTFIVSIETFAGGRAAPSCGQGKKCV